jgi:hypothetical protein
MPSDSMVGALLFYAYQKLSQNRKKKSTRKQKQADTSSACFCRYDHSRVIRNGAGNAAPSVEVLNMLLTIGKKIPEKM